MQKEMNAEIFQNNLLIAINEIKGKRDIIADEYYFILNPVLEESKPRLAIDEFMRLNVLNPEFTKGKIFSLTEIVTTLAFHSPLVPIWINIKLIDSKENKIFFQLDISLRFRKPSLLQNQETGHAPFKIII